MYHVTLRSLANLQGFEFAIEQLLPFFGKKSILEADDTLVSIREIFQRLGWYSALWALRALPERQHLAIRQLMVEFIEPVMQYVEEERLKRAFCVASLAARGEATPDQIEQAHRELADAKAHWKTRHGHCYVVLSSAIDWAVSGNICKVADVSEEVLRAIADTKFDVNEIRRVAGIELQRKIGAAQRQAFLRWLESC